MADTPEPPKTDTAAPSTPRRAPRKAPAKAAAPRASAKPAAKPATTEAPATTKTVTTKAPKPRSTKRATPRTGGKPAAAKPAPKTGRGWGTAAVVGGLATAGAVAAAAILSLRGSTPKLKPAPKPDKGAHQADGEDSSKSFDAGIADEGTVPN